MSECEFILIRHAQTVANTTQLACGQLDSQLTLAGKENASFIARAFFEKHSNPSNIYHSFLTRSRETAQIFSQYANNSPLSEVEGIEEQAFGEWEGRPWADVLPELKVGETPPNGESRAQYSQRVLGGIRAILKNHSNESIPIIVGHGGTFFAIGHQFGFEVIEIDNCFICKYKFENSYIDKPPIQTNVFNILKKDFEKEIIYV